MKFFAVIALVALSLAVSTCGGETGDSSGSGEPAAASPNPEDRRAAVKREDESSSVSLPSVAPKEAWRRKEPKIEARGGKPPKRVVVKDIIRGTGAEIQSGRPFGVNWTAVYFKSGEWRESSWDTGERYTFNFGVNQIVKGWEIGLKGMRVGGRRELIVPSRLAYDDGAIVYVVDLLEVS